MSRTRGCFLPVTLAVPCAVLVALTAALLEMTVAVASPATIPFICCANGPPNVIIGVGNTVSLQPEAGVSFYNRPLRFDDFGATSRLDTSGCPQFGIRLYFLVRTGEPLLSEGSTSGSIAGFRRMTTPATAPGRLIILGSPATCCWTATAIGPLEATTSGRFSPGGTVSSG